MSLELIHLTIAIFFTLAIDTFALFKYLKMNLKKACAVSLLINIASMIAAFIAQQYLVTKLPTDWFFLHHILNNYATVFLIFSTVTLAVKILVETLIITFFEKEVSTAVLWGVVIVMNIFTALPGLTYDFVRGKPKISAPFVLTENEDWIHNCSDTIYFLDANTKMLTAATPGSTNYFPLTSAEPFFGYRISAGGNAAITLGRTNVIVISVFNSNKLTKTYTFPSKVESVKLADVVPQKNIYVTCLSNTINCFDLQSGAPTGEVVKINSTNSVNKISICADSSKILSLVGKEKFVANWIDGKAMPIAESPKTFPSLICSIKDYAAISNSFNSSEAEINIVMNKGIEIKYKGEKYNFNVGTSARFMGIGFLSDGENFLFQLGGEIMVLNVKTKKVGHLFEGILGKIKK